MVWTPFHLGRNKVFDTEAFAVYQALRFIDRGQAGGYRCALSLAPPQPSSGCGLASLAHAIAAMYACDRILARNNQVTIRWAPAHNKVENEVADTFAKEVTGRTAPCCNAGTPDDFLDEASLS